MIIPNYTGIVVWRNRNMIKDMHDRLGCFGVQSPCRNEAILDPRPHFYLVFYRLFWVLSLTLAPSARQIPPQNPVSTTLLVVQVVPSMRL